MGWKARRQADSAQFRVTAAAILGQEGQEPADVFDPDPIADRPADPLAGDEAGAGEDREVGRHRVLRHVQLFCDDPGRQAVMPGAHQHAEGRKTRRLRQRGEGHDCARFIHESRLADMFNDTSAYLAASASTQKKEQADLLGMTFS